jgi:UDP-sulfoquinovose synthase
VFIAGVDGYLGWTLAQFLVARDFEVAGCDLFLRRKWVEEVGSQSATPIVSMEERLAVFKENFGRELVFKEGDLRDYDFVLEFFKSFQPEVIVHLGEMPSASYSMIDVHHCNFTQANNIVGTLNILYAMKEICPQAHLVKLGTMGEYGTPNIDIPEGFFTIEYRGRTETLPFPRQAGSWYHQTKVHDSHNVTFACKIWGLRSTDIMQGVVFGTRIDEMDNDPRLLTRFDFDQCFGTVLNRYCAEAVVGHPLSPFGVGQQRRGFLPLRDSMQCLNIAINNPPKENEYRVFNQFEEVYSVTQLAQKVIKVGNEFGLNVTMSNLENPRKEMEKHYYNPDHKNLLDLGYEPTHDVEQELRIIFQDLLQYKGRIEEKREALIPDIRWDGTRRKSRFLFNMIPQIVD